MVVEFLQLVMVVLTGLVVGSMMMEGIIFFAALRALEPGGRTTALGVASRRARRVIPPLAQTAMLAAVAVLVAWVVSDVADTTALLTLLGLAVMIPGVLVTYLLYFPSETRLIGDSSSAEAAFADMTRWHRLRFPFYVVAFLCFLFAAVN